MLVNINWKYNPSDRQKDIICFMQGYLGIELLTLLGVLAL